MPPNKIATGKIVKLDEDKHLVFGWASIIKDVDGKILLDRQNDYIDSEEELEKAAYDYVLKSRDGGEMHIRRGVSKMVESVVLTEEKQRMLGIPTGSTPTGWWIGFKVNDDRVWEQVKKGEYAGFSVHGTGRRESTELPISKITEVGKGESAGHPFRGNQWERGTGGGKPSSMSEADVAGKTKRKYQTDELKSFLEETKGNLQAETDLNGSNTEMARNLRNSIAQSERELSAGKKPLSASEWDKKVGALYARGLGGSSKKKTAKRVAGSKKKSSKKRVGVKRPNIKRG